MKPITTIIATIALAGCVTAPTTACNPYVPDAAGQQLYVGCIDQNAYAQPQQDAGAVGPAMLLMGLLLGAAIASTSTGSDRHYRSPPSRYRYAPRYNYRR